MAEDVAGVGVGDGAVTESLMNNFWDYDKKELEKTGHWSANSNL